MKRILLSALMTSSLAGCGGAAVDAPDRAATSAAGNATDPGGWRRGRVVQVGDAASLEAIDDGDCRHRDEADRPLDGRYVEVQYFVGRHAHLRIVPLVDGAQVVAGDTVYFKAGSCIEAVVR